ncbi:MAG: response regulator [Cephaloticoccus sp.]|nr:response regulator [Cephaloticoccus sp.]MCF7761690.1 response regulator [Cephaloticoccus sp.]
MNTKPTVLFIDDDATTRKLFTGGLAAAGILTHIVGTVEEAGAVLEQTKIDVIVTDLMMPGFNGVDLIKAVREADYTKHIPIIVFTSGGNLKLIEEALEAGANEIIQKHTTPPAKLIEKILQVHAAAMERK